MLIANPPFVYPKSPVIAVDFDGTIVDHEYPDIGDEIPGAISTLKDWQSRGAKLVLWTCRGFTKLDEAIWWCESKDLKFDFIGYYPADWTNSPKAYADVYIDDRGVGIPKNNKRLDWSRIKVLVEAQIGHRLLEVRQ